MCSKKPQYIAQEGIRVSRLVGLTRAKPYPQYLKENEMENLIVMAVNAGATVHNVNADVAVIIFNEIGLNDFVNRVASEVKQDLFNKIQGELK